MKKYFCFFILMLALGTNMQAQDSLFVGTWKIKDTQQKLKVPATIQIEMVNDSLVLIPKAGSDITRLVKYDSTSMVIEQITLNNKTKKFDITEYRFSINEKSNTIDAEVKSKDGQAPMVVKYAFQMVCCSNHHPNHCAMSSTDRQKMKELGCTGLHNK